MTTDQINQNPTQPGYTTQVRYPAQPNRNKSFTFQDTDLLNARQAALQKAQQLVTEKEAYEIIDVTVDLVEIDRSSTSDQHKVIATVFSQRFNRTLFMAEGKDLLVEMQLDALTAKSLPPSLFLTLQKEDAPVSSLESAWNGLNEMENEYYQQQRIEIEKGK